MVLGVILADGHAWLGKNHQSEYYIILSEIEEKKRKIVPFYNM